MTYETQKERLSIIFQRKGSNANQILLKLKSLLNPSTILKLKNAMTYRRYWSANFASDSLLLASSRGENPGPEVTLLRGCERSKGSHGRSNGPVAGS